MTTSQFTYTISPDKNPVIMGGEIREIARLLPNYGIICLDGRESSPHMNQRQNLYETIIVSLSVFRCWKESRRLLVLADYPTENLEVIDDLLREMELATLVTDGVNIQLLGDLNTSYLDVFQIILANDGITYSELSEALGITKPAAIERVERLYRLGFIKKSNQSQSGDKGRPVTGLTIVTPEAPAALDRFRWSERLLIQKDDLRMIRLGRLPITTIQCPE